MTYGLIYRLPFLSRTKRSYVIEIEKKDYAGAVTELIGGEEVFTTTLDDDDFVYLPLRLSTAKLTIQASDAMQGIFATEYLQYRVTLLLNNVPIWCGYVKPEEYTQDYNYEIEEIEVECLSSIATLEYIKYTQIDPTGLKFVSLKSLLERSLMIVNGRYNKIYMPHTFSADAASYGTNALMRDDCVISEQNFFDEEDNPMMYKDVLEEICRFAQMTLYDCGSNIFFVDHDYTDAYDEYTLQNGSLTLTTANALTKISKSVQSIGFTGNSHKLDIIAGYNKATVKTSNYNNISKVFPEEDWDTLKKLTDLLGEVDVIPTSGTPPLVRACYRRKLFEGTSWHPHYYAGTGLTADGHSTNANSLSLLPRGAVMEVVNEVTVPTAYVYHTGYPIDLNYGAYMAKYANYIKSDNPINYDYEEIILLHKVMISNVNGDTTYNYATFDPKAHSGFLDYRNHLITTAFANGAIVLSLQARYIPEYYDMLYYAGAKQGGPDSNKLTLTFMLKIGDKYYNGSEWVTTESTFNVDTEYDGASTDKKDPTTFYALKSNKTLAMPYNGATGYIIPVSDIQKGEIYFAIKDVNWNCAIKDLKIDFQVEDDYALSSSAGTGTDRTYTNVVNSDFINELDEIEEKISSYNFEGLSFSKVILGANFIKDNLYEGINKVVTRPENLLLRRIVNQYNEPKIKLTQVLEYDDTLRYIDRLTDDYQDSGKSFIITGSETNYADESSTVKMIEKA
jgi:hypothetical protein